MHIWYTLVQSLVRSETEWETEGNTVLDKLEESTNKDDQRIELTIRLWEFWNQERVRSNELYSAFERTIVSSAE